MHCVLWAFLFLHKGINFPNLDFNWRYKLKMTLFLVFFIFFLSDKHSHNWWYYLMTLAFSTLRTTWKSYYFETLAILCYSLVWKYLLLMVTFSLEKSEIINNATILQGPVRFKENSRLGNILINQIIYGEEARIGEYSGVTR